jgi:hypothetical protein
MSGDEMLDFRLTGGQTQLFEQGAQAVFAGVHGYVPPSAHWQNAILPVCRYGFPEM